MNEKTILLCVLFALCVAFWQNKRIRLKKRVLSLKKTRAFIASVKDDIRYAKRNIYDIINEDRTDFGLFRGLTRGGELLYIYYLKAKQANLTSFCFENGDTDIIDRFFRDFGVSDCAAQLRLCSEALSDTDVLIRDAEIKSARYSRLYTVAGISTGTLLIIFLL